MKLYDLTVMVSSYSSGLMLYPSQKGITHPANLNMLPIDATRSPHRQPSFAGYTSHSSAGSHPRFSAKGINFKRAVIPVACCIAKVTKSGLCPRGGIG